MTGLGVLARPPGWQMSSLDRAGALGLERILSPLSFFLSKSTAGPAVGWFLVHTADGPPSQCVCVCVCVCVVVGGGGLCVNEGEANKIPHKGGSQFCALRLPACHQPWGLWAKPWPPEEHCCLQGEGGGCLWVRDLGL